MSGSAWYVDSVIYAVQKQLMSGYGSRTFGPLNPLTRAQLVQILYNEAGRPAYGNGDSTVLLPPSTVDAARKAEESLLEPETAPEPEEPAETEEPEASGEEDPSETEETEETEEPSEPEPEPVPEELGFTDVPEGVWFTDAVLWAAENEIVFGYGDGRFGPNDPVTREQLSSILYRKAGSPEPGGTLNLFSDRNGASPYAVPALQWAVEKGILTGRGNGILDPRGKATRAEAAAMLMRYQQMAG